VSQDCNVPPGEAEGKLLGQCWRSGLLRQLYNLSDGSLPLTDTPRKIDGMPRRIKRADHW
jgi:hypothetical protein